MIRSFSEILERAKSEEPSVVAIAGGDSAHAIEIAILTENEGIAHPILVGDEGKIRDKLRMAALPSSRIRVLSSSSPSDDAMRLCLEGKANFVVKGNVKSSEILHSALTVCEPKEEGRFLSHIAIIENPKSLSGHKLLLVTDGGLNVLPSLSEKKRIMENAIWLAHRLGIEKPKVILAAGMEDTGQEIPAIADAREIVKEHRQGRWSDAIIDGPFGVDVGLDAESARIKGIDTPIAGDVDIILCPNLESCNIAVKMVLYYTGSFMLGIVVGGVAPILLVSRSAPVQANLLSIALAKVVT